MKKAFGFIEIMVIIVIITILSLTVFIVGIKYIISSRNTTRISDITQITQSLQGYYITNYTYPMPSNQLQITDMSGTLGTMGYQGIFDEKVKDLGVPIDKTPKDPFNQKYYSYTRIDLGGKGIEIGGMLEEDGMIKIDYVNTAFKGTTRQNKVYMNNQYNTGDFGIFQMPYLTTYYSGSFLDSQNLGAGGIIYLDLKQRKVSRLDGTLSGNFVTGNIEILSQNNY